MKIVSRLTQNCWIHIDLINNSSDECGTEITNCWLNNNKQIIKSQLLSMKKKKQTNCQWTNDSQAEDIKKQCAIVASNQSDTQNVKSFLDSTRNFSILNDYIVISCKFKKSPSTKHDLIKATTTNIAI